MKLIIALLKVALKPADPSTLFGWFVILLVLGMLFILGGLAVSAGVVLP